MSEADVPEVIVQTARTVFRQPSLAFSSGQRFRDIPGFDSVLAIQFILAIENALGVMLTEAEVDTMHTMGDLLVVLQAKG